MVCYLAGAISGLGRDSRGGEVLSGEHQGAGWGKGAAGFTNPGKGHHTPQDRGLGVRSRLGGGAQRRMTGKSRCHHYCPPDPKVLVRIDGRDDLRLWRTKDR